MKKPNEKTNVFPTITPAEEQAILLEFERYVANYVTEEISQTKKRNQMKTSKSNNWKAFLPKSTSPVVVAISTCFCLFLFCSPAFSQNETTWKGGTPGQETNWACPKNWSDYKVPDEFSDVFITNTSTTTFAYPTIQSGTVEVNSLHLNPEATLTIGEDAQVIVYENITGILNENVIVQGSLLVIGNPETKNLQASHSPVHK